MKAMDLLVALGGVKDVYVIGAENFRQGKQKSQGKRLSLRKAWLIAAAIALMLLLVGCTVAYVLSLEDMTFGEEVQEYYDGSSQKRTLLSLQGVEGTPGYQASKEWYEWLQTYDTDESVYHSEEAFSEDFGDAYYAYNLYSREMKDKVDEICAKYGLELLGKMYVDPDVEAACQALQIQGILRPDAQAEVDWGSVRYYENGSFDVEGHMTLTGKAEARVVDYSCIRKDAFGDVYGSIGPVGSYEEWTYTTSDGVDVLMVIEKESISGHAFMIVDRGPYVFFFSAYDFEGNRPIEKEELEAFAEAFDFTVEPQRVTKENLEAADERREAADAEFEVEHDKYLHSYQELGYDSRIKFQLEHCTHPDQLGYALMDLNGDGTEELLIGENGYIRAVYAKRDTGSQHLMPLSIVFSGGISHASNYVDSIGAGYVADATYICLCEGNRLLYVYDTEGEDVAYFLAEAVDGEFQWAYRIRYCTSDEYYRDNPWVQFDLYNISQSITEERFQEILASAGKRISIDFTPLSQYPLQDDSPSGIGRPDSVYSSYDSFISDRANYQANYCLLDLDGDGQEELIWQQGRWNGVLTITGGQVRVLECGEELSICQGNVIALTRRYQDGNKADSYYKVENGKLVLTDYLRYDKDKDSENPWFQSDDNSGQDISMVPISQETYDAIQAKYTPMELDMKPVSQYPLK